MEKQNIIIFAGVAIVGLLIVIWGFKFHTKTRRLIDTIGAIIFHVGAFGILYYKVEINIFISLVLLVLSLFILIDPLKISQLFNSHKIYHVFGYLSLLFSVVFSLEYFLHFPVWLWMIPLIIYILPYLIVPLRQHFRLISFLAWLIVFTYITIIGYSIYKKYYSNSHLTNIKALGTFTTKPKQPSQITQDLNLDPDPVKIPLEVQNAELIEENLNLKKQLEELQENQPQPTPSLPAN